jgi:hypothetical protein
VGFPRRGHTPTCHRRSQHNGPGARGRSGPGAGTEGARLRAGPKRRGQPSPRRTASARRA